jgi:hypothetical protein
MRNGYTKFDLGHLPSRPERSYLSSDNEQEAEEDEEGDREIQPQAMEAGNATSNSANDSRDPKTEDLDQHKETSGEKKNTKGRAGSSVTFPYDTDMIALHLSSEQHYST